VSGCRYIIAAFLYVDDLEKNQAGNQKPTRPAAHELFASAKRARVGASPEASDAGFSFNFA